MSRPSILTGWLMFAMAIGTSASAQQPTIVPRFDPRDFRAGPIDNPLLPLRPGAVYVLEVRDGSDLSVDSIIVTDRTRRIAGVTAVVVHDIVRRGGAIVEDTYDWYAQDVSGNVWYLGEDTKEYRAGRVVSTSGSWEAGVHGARAGIVMQGHPRVGDSYRQEYRKGIAEDMGRVVRVGDSVAVRAGRFANCVTTEDWTPLEKGVLERKTYCSGVGLVREQTVRGGTERSELVALRRP